MATQPAAPPLPGKVVNMIIQHYWQDNYKIRMLVLLTRRTDAPLHLQRL